jgi:hypothetical protein
MHRLWLFLTHVEESYETESNEVVPGIHGDDRAFWYGNAGKGRNPIA